MNCRDAKSHLALLIGHDLNDPATIVEVRHHLSQCPDCLGHYRHLKQAMAALEQSETPATYIEQGSLWPALSSRLVGSRNEPARSIVQQHWFPVASFAAACVLLLAVIQFDRPGTGFTPGVSTPRVQHLPAGEVGLERATIPSLSHLSKPVQKGSTKEKNPLDYTRLEYAE